VTPDHQLVLVQSWFDRELTETELITARQMLARGDRAPYIARFLDMRARADRPKEQTT
jgi:hypothetical protein